MRTEWVLLMGMMASLVAGALCGWWLRDALRALLGQLCDRPAATDFWSRYTLLMLLIAPLSVVVFFAPDFVADRAAVLRRMLLAVLLGHFATFALAGRGLFKAVRQAASTTPADGR